MDAELVMDELLQVNETCESSSLVCDISTVEVSKRNVIAVLRMLVSILSLTGSLSIIVSVVARKQVTASKVHPIFVLSVADCVLSSMWILGGSLWLTRVASRVWCFLPSLLSVVLECVTINLTLVYAGFAYTAIKRTNVVQSLLPRGGTSVAIRPCTTLIVYCIAWLFPVVLIMCSFAVIAILYNITERANSCSCWCLPYFGNILPLAFPEEKGAAQYVWDIRKLVATYGVVLGTNYLLIFILLVVIYIKILKHVRHMRRQHALLHDSLPNYGAIENLIEKGEIAARKRVIVFLTVFVITGCVNFILSCMFAVFESVELHKGPHIEAQVRDHLPPAQFILYLLESVTVPMQGFLNAIVYGWTHEDFRAAVALARQKGKEMDHSSVIQVSYERP